jgi:CBS domain-containing protein
MPVPHFFDMRQIKGNEEPVEALREHLFGLASSSEDLMDFIATVTVENRPPLGFFRRFVVEKSGEHRNEFDLTMKGIRPLVDAVRVFAVEKGFRETSTVKRLQHLGERYGFEHAEDMEHALNYLDSLLINHQLEQIERGLEPDTFINPERLSTIEKKTLREIFQLTARVYDIIEKNYRTERVM